MKRAITLILLVLVAGCAGLGRSCSSWQAQSFGSDWLIVQYASSGEPINCWWLTNESVSNEQASDGIYWKQTGHLVHISGWYNRVQVGSGGFEEAAKLVGVSLPSCVNGRYQK